MIERIKIWGESVYRAAWAAAVLALFVCLFSFAIGLGLALAFALVK